MADLTGLEPLAATFKQAYEDALQPAAKELGKHLETVVNATRLLLLPLQAAVWGYDVIAEYVQVALARRFHQRGVGVDQIITPDLTVAGPTVEALRFAGHKEELREMYANLLATAMDPSTAHLAHPSFPEILRQLNPDEARLLKVLAKGVGRDGSATVGYWPIIQVVALRERGYTDVLPLFSLLGETAGCERPDLAPEYLYNLDRLSIIELSFTHRIPFDEVYVPLETRPEIQEICAELDKDKGGPGYKIRRGAIIRTRFGVTFLSSCVV